MIGMKKMLFMLPLVFAIAACGSSEKKQIKTVAYNYSIAMANYKVADAEPYCTEETRNTTINAAYVLMNMVDSAYVASDTPATIKITDVRIETDTVAWAKYHKVSPLTNYSDSLELRKRDGGWFVHTPM